jgi:hypothetical protein
MKSSQASAAERRPAKAWMPATVETPTTILATAGTPTATEVSETVWTPTTHDFWENL